MSLLNILMITSVALGTPAAPDPPTAVLGPADSSNLVLAAPIDRWDEAVPLGNGLLGGLLWGNGSMLRLSLDRGDLWDLRVPEMLQRDDWTYATMQRLAAEQNHAQHVELFDVPYDTIPYPTKVPVGRLEITLAPGTSITSFGLDLRRALGWASAAPASAPAEPIASVFFSANEPVALLRVRGAVGSHLAGPIQLERQLGYPPAEIGGTFKEDAGLGITESYYVQHAALGLSYAVVVRWHHRTDIDEFAIAITSSRDDPDPLALGRRRVATALARGFDELRTAHEAWWQSFWATSGVRVPDPGIQQHYDLVQYFYGAASRRGAPPMPLQGVWTADEGGLPPWKGDYHNDLNTQLTYWAYLAAGRFDEGAAFLDFLWDLLPAHRRFARRFYAAPGAAVPGVMTLTGEPLGGWGQYSLSPTNGAWVAQAFYLHWRYTLDPQFLAQRAYPYCSALGDCLAALLKPDAAGLLVLPLSSSPEIHDNAPAAWMTPNSNYDLALLRWLFGALAEMADALGPPDGGPAAAARWRDLLAHLAPLAVENDEGPLRLSPTESLAESHRHFSHLLALHPLGTLSIEGSERDRRIIGASLAQLEPLGTQAWCGYSFSWMACMQARCGRPDAALDFLQKYLRAFVSRNGFHLNGDFKNLGLSGLKYRPFTLEGNFAAAQAVHEMLLQSWGGVVRIFSAVPDPWRDVAFDDLRAEGAFRVSARRTAGRTEWVRISATRPGLLRLRDPFGETPATWNRPDAQRNGRILECMMEPGDELTARVPDAPAKPGAP